MRLYNAICCGNSLRDNGKLHCPSGSCPWITCGGCKSIVDADTANYWNGKQLMWGNEDGYLKAD